MNFYFFRVIPRDRIYKFQFVEQLSVGADALSRVTWYPPVQGHGIQLISLNAVDGFPVPTKGEDKL